jgi:hypothetical protein
MAESKPIVVNSHKDIEALVERWGGFGLLETFHSRDGACFINDDRPNLQTPWPKTGQIYRTLHEDYTELGNHRYALVTEDGEVILSAKLSFSGRSCYGQDIEKFAERYSQLKRHLEKARVGYTPDTEFETSIIEAGRILQS